MTRSLADNSIGGYWDNNLRQIVHTVEGITALYDGLKGSAVTSLTCAAAPNLHADCTQRHSPADPQKCSAPAAHFSPHVIPPSLGSLNGNELGVEGAKAIAAVLKDAQLSTLRSTPARCLHAMSLPCRPQKCSVPAELFSLLDSQPRG